MVANEQELPIREFPDRGTLWLLESPENLRGLLRLLAQEITDQLDFSRAERFNRSFVPDDLHKTEADLLYRVPFKNADHTVWVFVLLEHQSRPDRLIGLRLLSYMVQVWETQRRSWEDARTPHSKRWLSPILPVLFYTGKRRWTTPPTLEAIMDAPAALAPFIPRHETLFLNLHETSVASLQGSVVGCVLQVLQAEDAPLARIEQVLSQAVSCLEDLSEEHQVEWRRAMYYLVLLIRHRRTLDEQDVLYNTVTEAVRQNHREEVEEMAITGAEALLRQGRKEGRKEGRDEGREEVLIELLEAKFGALSEQTVAAVKALPLERRKALTRQILIAQSLADLHLEPTAKA